MKRWLARVIDFVQREDGPTAVEYAVMLSLIVVVREREPPRSGGLP